MAEKLFVIMEVVEIDPGEISPGINHHYKPVDAKNDGWADEELWLRPERVIPASRLRYGNPRTGQRYFHASTHSDSISGRAHGFCIADSSWGDGKAPDYRLLLLDPPAPVDEWEKWVEEMPLATNYQNDEECLDMDRKAWLKRCPRGK